MAVSNLGIWSQRQHWIFRLLHRIQHSLKMLVRGLDNQLKLVENSFKGQRDKLSGLKASHLQLGKVLEGNQALFANQARRYQNIKMETGASIMQQKSRRCNY